MGCGGGSGEDEYPEQAREQFVRECAEQPNTTARACTCVLEEVERTMPYEEFKEAEEAIRNDRAPRTESAEKLRDAVSVCLTG